MARVDVGVDVGVAKGMHTCALSTPRLQSNTDALPASDVYLAIVNMSNVAV